MPWFVFTFSSELFLHAFQQKDGHTEHLWRTWVHTKHVSSKATSIPVPAFLGVLSLRPSQPSSLFSRFNEDLRRKAVRNSKCSETLSDTSGAESGRTQQSKSHGSRLNAKFHTVDGQNIETLENVCLPRSQKKSNLPTWHVTRTLFNIAIWGRGCHANLFLRVRILCPSTVCATVKPLLTLHYHRTFEASHHCFMFRGRTKPKKGIIDFEFPTSIILEGFGVSLYQ